MFYHLQFTRCVLGVRFKCVVNVDGKEKDVFYVVLCKAFFPRELTQYDLGR